MSGRNSKLDPKAVVVAKKEVRLNGTLYKIGDVIKDSTISFRTKEKLYRVGIVVTAEEFEVKRNKYGTPVVEQPVVEVTPDEVPAEEVEEASEDETEEQGETEKVDAEPVVSAPVKARGRPRKVQ